MTLLLAFDPGGTTGFAAKTSLVDDRYVTCTMDLREQVWQALKDSGPGTHVAFEEFHTGGRVDNAMLHTIELVGSIRALCWAYGHTPHPQSPQSRKSFMLKARMLIRQSGPPNRPGLQHETDALAHLLLLEYRLGLTKGEK